MQNEQKTHKPFYVTTTLPYVNARPHVGFAMEILRADTMARYKKIMGHEVFFNTGTDEHGQKLYTGAQKEGIDVQEYVDRYAAEFRKLKDVLKLYPDIIFIRTTDQSHVSAAQAFWKKCLDNGYIYKKNYQAKYCVGCELEKTDSELVNGECPVHPGKELETINEENYFFKFSAFQDKLIELYKDNPMFVRPDFRLKEIQKFCESGLRDFSISRLKSKMPWGVPVPGDEDHVMYVWFDALVNYISTLGWPNEGSDNNFDIFWRNGDAYQYCGKDNLRQQSAMWQAMLMAADLPNSTGINVGGFINSGGQKMSKSLGNVISPFDILEKFSKVTPFPEDVLRYYFMRHVHPFDDSDVTDEKIDEAYTAHLVNGLGNLVSRLLNMADKYEVEFDTNSLAYNSGKEDELSQKYHQHLNDFRIDLAYEIVWNRINDIDGFITQTEPFKTIKTDSDKAKADVTKAIEGLGYIVKELRPLMPETATAIIAAISEKKKPETPLFARL